MFSRGPGPAPSRPQAISPQASPHPHEVAVVLNTISEILAASAEINRRDKRGNSCLPVATLDRVIALSESLWEEVMSLPLSTVPPLQKPLILYGLILVDILSSSGSVEILDGTIDRRLDDFLLQFRDALDLLKGPTGQQSSPNSTHFFQNSHHITISGGNFIASTNNPVTVVHDPVVREQSHKILQRVTINLPKTVVAAMKGEKRLSTVIKFGLSPSADPAFLPGSRSALAVCLSLVHKSLGGQFVVTAFRVDSGLIIVRCGL